MNDAYLLRLVLSDFIGRTSSHLTVWFERALAFKWMRIIYRCWKTRTQYDEAKYLLALEA
ncbi:hypothetical protein EH227_22700 [Rouxiella chamberiensis]|nr:hypothetical protein EH227_22700 [Rouxiella chamberiensis]